MEIMDELFVPYDEAFALYELGFNEPCFRLFCIEDKLPGGVADEESIDMAIEISEGSYIKSPLYQQAIDWFEKNHHLKVDWMKYVVEGYSDTYYPIIFDFKNKKEHNWKYSIDFRFDSKKNALLKSINEAIKIIK